MKKLLVPALLLLSGCQSCQKEEQSMSGRDAASDVTAIRFDAAGDSPYRYRYWNQNDSLARFMVVVPMSFSMREVRSCDHRECLAELVFEGDDITIRAYGPPAKEERRSLDDDKKERTKAGEVVVSEHAVKHGWAFTTTANSGKTYVFHEQVSTFVSPIRLEVRGPIEKKAAVDEIWTRMSNELLLSHRKPEHYCQDLPWSPPEARKKTFDFVGTLKEETVKDETFFVLSLDEPVCNPFGRAIWELQVTGKPNLKLDLGKHVRAKGNFDIPEGRKRPITADLSVVTEEARDAGADGG